jgi:hypothetical protein
MNQEKEQKETPHWSVPALFPGTLGILVLFYYNYSNVIEKGHM